MDTKTGIYDMPADEYHLHHGISSTGLRKLLPPHCPASFRYGEPTSSPAFDFGKVAHRLVLGDGEAYTVSPFDSFRTNEAKAWRAEQEQAGVTVISADDLARAQAMAATVRAHPWAGLLFTEGKAEQSLFWVDEETGVQCRARYDYLRDIQGERRLLIPDYKTTRSAEPGKFAKSAADYGYHQQAAFYMDAAIALGLDDDPAFVFVAQEKAQPYLVTVVELDDEAIRLGRALNRRALRLYAECAAKDEWPGYVPGVATVQLPSYYVYATEEYLNV